MYIILWTKQLAVCGLFVHASVTYIEVTDVCVICNPITYIVYMSCSIIVQISHVIAMETTA